MKEKTASCLILTLLLISTLALAVNVQPVKADFDLFLEITDAVGDPLSAYDWIGNLYDPVVIGPLLLQPHVLGAVAFSFMVGYRTGQEINSIIDGTADLSIGGILKAIKRIVVGKQPGNGTTTSFTYDWTETYGNGTMMEGNFTFNGVCTTQGVGGVIGQIDKLGLLAPYIGLASTMMIGAVATAIYVQRVKRRKEKQ